MKLSLWAVSAFSVLLPWMAWCQIGNIVVTNAASFRTGIPAPGSIGTIFCTGLVVTGIVSASGVPLPFNLSGVTVTVGGSSAPLFALADLGGYQQINFQVPQETQVNVGTTGDTAEVTISQNGNQGKATASLAPQLGDFFRVGTTQYGIFQHSADYSLVTTANPARRGETLVAYATGLEPPTPSVPIGQPAPLSPLYYVPQNGVQPFIDLTGLLIIDSVGNRFAVFNLGGGTYDPNGSLPFMGLTPGAIGLYQINFVLPPGLSSGNATINLRHLACNPAASPFGDCQAPGATVALDSQAVLLPVQ
jgi:uncharacterized protein (TIGR03437 family)